MNGTQEALNLRNWYQPIPRDIESVIPVTLARYEEQ
jgi:hypothetical protein